MGPLKVARISQKTDPGQCIVGFASSSFFDDNDDNDDDDDDLQIVAAADADASVKEDVGKPDVSVAQSDNEGTSNETTTWYFVDVKKQWRKFNIDLMPKVFRDFLIVCRLWQLDENFIVTHYRCSLLIVDTVHLL